MDDNKRYDEHSVSEPTENSSQNPVESTETKAIETQEPSNMMNSEPVMSKDEPVLMKEDVLDHIENNDKASEKEVIETPQAQYYWQPSIPVPETKPKKRRFAKLAAGFMILVLVAGTFFGAGYVSSVYLSDSILGDLFGSPQIVADSKVSVNQIQPVVNMDTSYEQAPVMIAEEVGPAIVTINTQYETGGYSYFYDYFGEGSGSGSIFDINDESLLIVTNYHVIQDATGLSVSLFDGSAFDDIDVLGYDSSLDLAIISIPVDSIPDNLLNQLSVVSFGDSDDLKLGEMAIALGSPLGEEFANTITVGVISGLDRTLSIDNVNHSYIQTDASINPGNSGGALLNIEGELIGINTAKSIDVDVEGMGFAIPINLAEPIINEIVSNPTGGDIASDLSTDRPFLGVQIQDIVPGISEDVEVPFGVYVSDVFEGGGAEEAGIQAGDVIVAIDGERILNTAELTSAILSHQVGDELEITIIRGDEVLDVTAPLYHYDDVVSE